MTRETCCAAGGTGAGESISIVCGARAPPSRHVIGRSQPRLLVVRFHTRGVCLESRVALGGAASVYPRPALLWPVYICRIHAVHVSLLFCLIFESSVPKVSSPAFQSVRRTTLHIYSSLCSLPPSATTPQQQRIVESITCVPFLFSCPTQAPIARSTSSGAAVSSSPSPRESYAYTSRGGGSVGGGSSVGSQRSLENPTVFHLLYRVSDDTKSAKGRDPTHCADGADGAAVGIPRRVPPVAKGPVNWDGHRAGETTEVLVAYDAPYPSLPDWADEPVHTEATKHFLLHDFCSILL